MKNKNGYWVDVFGNRWNATKYSEIIAKEMSNGLLHCANCTNCFNCSSCMNCFDCINCAGCSHCLECSHCYNCTSCTNCFDCSGCSNFIENPQRLYSKRIEEHDPRVKVYWTDITGVQVVWECFTWKLNQFEEHVKSTYKDNPIVLTNYLKFIEVVRTAITY